MVHERVQHSLVGRVRDAHGDGGAAGADGCPIGPGLVAERVLGAQFVDGRGDEVEAVVALVRVVDAEELEVRAAQVEARRGVVEVVPAELARSRRAARRCRGRFASRADAATGSPKYVNGFFNVGAEVVVRAVDEDARDAAERLERATDALEAPLVAEVVAGVDDEVGLELGRALRTHSCLLALPRRHVQVGEVQHARGAPHPAGSTGTSACRSVHRVRSTRVPHASAPTPAAPIARAIAAAGEVRRGRHVGDSRASRRRALRRHRACRT